MIKEIYAKDLKVDDMVVIFETPAKVIFVELSPSGKTVAYRLENDSKRRLGINSKIDILKN